MKLNIPHLMNSLTLEEKAGLCSGANYWFTKAVGRLGLPAVMVSDGPHGLRKQEGETDGFGIGVTVEAVCFPSGAALASSFDRDAVGEVGLRLGEEARAEHVHTLLGPALNMKRSPLCGRNFEYLSEDPYLAGELGAAYVRGVQSKNVGTAVKHFAANNQEQARMSVSVRADERTLREIYLAAFEKVVRQAKPWSLMCSYNRINGVYSCENDWLLNQMLRGEWGFDGIVMTDWGAMDDRCEALKAGLNLEMPASYGINDRKIVEAVQTGTLDKTVLDKAVKELLEWIDKGLAEQPEIASYDKEKHHAAARRAAAESAVLLKNKGLLPLKKGIKTAFIGTFAKTPRYQGGGSSHIRSFQVTGALEAARSIGGIVYAPGFEDDGETANPARLDEAVKAAGAADAAVIFAGLPESFESEGYDRTNLELPACQNELIAKICEAQPNTVVVLHNGSPVTMPWADGAAAILEMYLGGQAVGEAEIDLLYGDVNPSGKLAETFPLRLEDTPSYLDFPGTAQEVSYGEGVFIGYRWYDARKMDVLFPFGHGLSYTTFEYSGLALSSGEIRDTDPLLVAVTVKNTGSVFGKETVQLYVGPEGRPSVPRPVRELKGFAKVALQPGEAKTVTFTLNRRSFAYYETQIGDWYVAGGTYRIDVGRSSRDLPLTADVKVIGTKKIPFVLESSATVGDLLDRYEHPEDVKPLTDRLKQTYADNGVQNAMGEGSDEMIRRMLDGMPLHSLVNFLPVGIDEIRKMLKHQ